MRILIIGMIAMLMASCSKKENKGGLGTQNLLLQVFQIDPAKDTLLTTIDHCKISIPKGSFQNNGMVTIRIREAVTFEEIVRARLTTRSDGVLLQSGGMIFIDGQQNSAVAKILKPIEISIPTKLYNPGMRIFSGVPSKDSVINWKNPDLLLHESERKLTDKGQILFNNCKSCHSIANDLVGPALAFVNERRCMDWLTEVTRNPASMIKQDLCLKEQYQKYGSLMTSFPALSDSDIEALYAYIQKESERLTGEAAACHPCYDPCNGLKINDTSGVTVQRTSTSVKVGQVSKPNREKTNGASISDPDTTGSPLQTYPQRSLPDEYYTFTIESFGWYNIDCYIDKGNQVEDSHLLVSVSGGSYDDLSVYLLIPSEKIFVEGLRNSIGKYGFYQDDSIPLPQNKTAYILAVYSVTEKPLFGKIKFTTSRTQDLEIRMDANMDIIQEIKSMKLDEFAIEMTHEKSEKKQLINERIFQFKCPARDSANIVSPVEGP